MPLATRGASRNLQLAVFGIALMALPRSGSVARAQVTTAGISVSVHDEDGRAVSAAAVIVINRANGFRAEGQTHENGSYRVAGLEAGGPYTVTVRRIGYSAHTENGLRLTLSQILRVEIRLDRQAVTLQAMRTVTNGSSRMSSAPGVATLITDSALHRLPTADRDLYAFVRLTPQVSTSYQISGAGASPRTNAVMIDGTSEQGLYGGLPAGNYFGGKTISLEAVKEYRVEIAPYDVRQGNFAGATINAVTRSGTNELHGTAFYYGRYGALSRNVPLLRDARFERTQSGVAVGGPLVRDHAHFFVATEFQQMLFPTVGPYVGQRATSETPLPVNPDTIAAFQQLLKAKGLDGGSAGPITASNPLANVFARIDVALPRLNSRFVVRENYARADTMTFSRPSPAPTPNCLTLACFPLSSQERDQLSDKTSLVFQLYTSFSTGVYNELFAGTVRSMVKETPTVNAPLILVRAGGGTLQSGTYELAQGDRTESRSVEITDNLSMPLGAHQLTVGLTGQFFRVRRFDVRGAYGVWQFNTLDSLRDALPSRYRVTEDIAGADITVPGAQYGAYAGDRWEVSPRFALTYGLRADLPTLAARPPFNDAVSASFGRRTDVVPASRVQWSPRAGFTLDVTGDQRTQLRGGVGAFAGRPPLIWIANAFANYGEPRTLNCGGPGLPAPPAFSTDYRNPPLVCG
ncbi:MAG TPA: carboxypeptidase regulatory-like domain-containing protein, partial [Gemmatimonadaceae bacterium]|nr:carboxypeptidase regulatory-like domain-containing protein [Gemmatimonadaceae bacterium]